MALRKGYKALLEEANSRIRTYTVQEAQARLAGAGALLVDLRESREQEREGIIPGAFHAPRGMLEFWIDPESPYYKPVFGEEREFIFFCAGGWRSALAADAVQTMGLAPVAHIEGGFQAWKKAGAPVADKPKKA
ncbi:MAG: rhodanese-like domain-containing protein [Noviherbaspirillum sp.]